MGRQLFRTSYKHRIVASNADEVIAVMPIPAGGMLTNVWGDVHMVGTINLNRDFATLYSCGGFIMPALNEDFSTSVDTFFDQHVPKDGDVATTAGNVSVDISPAASSGPYEEPGEASQNRLWNVFETSQRIYDRQKILTIASRGLMEPVASSEDDLWMPNDHFKVRIRDRYRVNQTSYAMFAIASPAIDDEETANEATMDANELAMFENIETMITLALPWILGLSEAGAETPFLVLAQFIEELIEPTVESETAGAFNVATYNVFARFTFEVQFGPSGINKGPLAG